MSPAFCKSHRRLCRQLRWFLGILFLGSAGFGLMDLMVSSHLETTKLPSEVPLPKCDTHVQDSRRGSSSVRLFIRGGTGNQLFMYAAGLAFADSLELPFFISPSPMHPIVTQPSRNTSSRDFMLPFFNLPNCSFLDFKRWERLAGDSSNVFVGEINFFQILDERKGIKGRYSATSTTFLFDLDYFQSPIFFDHLRPALQQTLSLEKYMATSRLDSVDELLQVIASTNSVAVHVRRGDFVQSRNISSLPSTYYTEAMELMSSMAPGPHFFVFSDDIRGVAAEFQRLNLTLTYTVTFVSDHFGSVDVLQEFYVMGKCKHFIISNSTFAWWAAYLNWIKGRSIVITPSRRFSPKDILKEYDEKLLGNNFHLFPQDWITLEAWSIHGLRVVKRKRKSRPFV